ncbi:MAG: ABC transporter substrate-binding protein [Thermoleophilia bacterium]|nr:ABC transporter substrate-binding protein [Thermoleophilia bacterium]
MTVRIGHLSTFYHTSILLMADKTTAERLGAETEWILMGTGPDLVGAIGRGELEIAYIGLPPALVGISGGVPIVCVAGGHEEGTVAIGRVEDSGYPEHRDLGAVLGQYEGERIGVPGKGSIHDVILADALARHGLTGKIDIVNFRWADMVTEALAEGNVRAAFGTPALAVSARRYARCKIIWPPNLLWPENPSYGILARKEFVEAAPELLKSFLLLHEEATKRIREVPGEAASTIAKFVSVVESDFVLEAISVSPRYCAALTPGFIDCTMRFAGAMKSLGYIERIPGMEEVFDSSFINEVHGPGEHYSKGINKGGL